MRASGKNNFDNSLILAFDPGVTTGVAYYDRVQDHYFFNELDGPLKEIYEFLFELQPTCVVYEEFRYRPVQGHAILYSVEVIGVVKLYCQDSYITPDLHPPAITKPFWTDDKIKKLGLWRPGQGHAMDALRQLLRHRQAYEPDWFKETLYKLK